MNYRFPPQTIGGPKVEVSDHDGEITAVVWKDDRRDDETIIPVDDRSAARRCIDAIRGIVADQQ